MGFWRCTNYTLCDSESTVTAISYPVFVQCDRFSNLFIISQKMQLTFIDSPHHICRGMMHCVRYATRYVAISIDCKQQLRYFNYDLAQNQIFPYLILCRVKYNESNFEHNKI